ncbi:MAG: hypothetical protein HUU09_09795 [Candidatus Jettenia caeni]|nr:MAG: hypothetical protein EDM77_04960 [Candidatus Jettenia sp. AMX1]MCE7879643.1 hypothetical protein [Candidatus Jettenia sp. AMX1]MCQ3926511.1 hypothetical protein [Candidatus Jettenia sp.]MDL1938182.1 hypothetical protein [Candidatus Jettenia sp. AMX1]NUN23744.1 hypothetical protein [Candidatus Jettenia caeni]
MKSNIILNRGKTTSLVIARVLSEAIPKAEIASSLTPRNDIFKDFIRFIHQHTIKDSTFATSCSVSSLGCYRYGGIIVSRSIIGIFSAIFKILSLIMVTQER